VKITIHQAICGEQNKAWDLIRTTLPDNSAAKKIAFQADLQDSPSSGITWLPAIRGFLVNDYYLLTRCAVKMPTHILNDLEVYCSLN